jgi:hypothetical protein
MLGLGMRLGRATRRRGHAGLIWELEYNAGAGAVVLPAPLALTRASGATCRTGASTIDSTISVNVARLYFDGATRGLLIEPAATNLIANSRDLTASSYLAGSSVTTTSNYAAGPDGQVLADRSTVASGGYSRHANVTGLSPGAPYVGSLWLRHATGSGSYQASVFSGLTDHPLTGVATTTWIRRVAAITLSGTNAGIVPADGRDQTSNGGIAAGSRDTVSDLLQLEAGRIATSSIVTAGGTATRAGDRLYADAAATLSAGRLGLEYVLHPLGASSDYLADYYVWYVNASTYARVSAATRMISVVINGVPWSSAALPTWSADQELRIWIEAGGGAMQSAAKARVGGGPVVDLGSSGSPQAAIAGSTVDLLCAGASSQMACVASRLAAYSSGRRPGWAA